MKIAITAGGGGHFAPALALISLLPKDWEVILFGRKYVFEGDRTESLEYKTAQEQHIPFISLTTGRLQRKFTRHTLASFLKLPVGFFQAYMALRREKPDAVMSFGGYVSLPVVVSAFFQNIPVVVHEQTLGVGLANKLSAFFAEKVCISFEESEKFFPKEKVILTGNPVKKFSINDLPFQISKEDLPLLYITGGSSGSHAINVLIENGLEELLIKYRIIHQTGDAREFQDFEKLEEKQKNLSPELQKRYYVTKFVSPFDVGSVISASDIVISRAGMNSVCELMYFGKPSIFIPLPFAQENEQGKNAEFAKKIGMAEVLEQDSATTQTLLQTIGKIETSIDRYRNGGEKAKGLIKEDAAKEIFTVLKQTIEKRNNTK